MVTVGFMLSSEDHDPRTLIDTGARAEQAGLRKLWISDHFHPWNAEQGHAPFVWSVIGGLAVATSEMEVFTAVTCPTVRLHPAIVAQAAATTEAMYPGRHWLGLGSGEALNEHVVAGYWPEGPQRVSMLFEAVRLIRQLFEASLAGKDTKFAGEHFRMESTRLWTMPEQAPPVYVATAGPVSSKRTGKYCDGLITVGAPLSKIDMILTKFAEGAREEGKDPDTMPKLLQLHLSWAETDEQALANALDQWPNGGMKFPKADIRSPHDFAAMAQLVRAEDFEGRMIVSADPDEHRAYIQTFFDAGIDKVYLHNVGRNQREFLEVFGRDVLPALHR